MVERKEIKKITWIDKSLQLSDCLTKRGASSYKLLQALAEGRFLAIPSGCHVHIVNSIKDCHELLVSLCLRSGGRSVVGRKGRQAI